MYRLPLRVEPRRHPARDRDDVDGSRRSGRAEPRRRLDDVDRPHKRAAHDARPARTEGRLRA